MANPLHIKGSRTKVLNTFPRREIGADGDFIISRISGRGVFLCTKAGGTWYVANRLQELNKVGKLSSDSVSTKNLVISKLINSKKDTDKFVVSEDGQIKYRTGDEVVDDLDIPIADIEYKQAYCSLGQYTNKKDCEANNGKWYYSDNDSHDSISSTAENELLTVASSLGKLDAEPTLLYDGSTLEIKRNSDYDDNWQTSAQDSLLKLSYDSSNNAIFGVNSSGHFTLDVAGVIALSADCGNIMMDDGSTTIFDFDVDGVNLKIMDDANTSDYFNIAVGAEGATTISTVDADTDVAHLTLQPNGDLILDPSSQKVIINATDKLYFDGGGNTYIYESGGDILDFYVGGQQMLQLRNFGFGVDNVSVYNGHLAVPEGKNVYLDGNSGGEYLTSVDQDILFYAGGSAVLELTDEGTVAFKNDYQFDATSDNVLDIQDSGASVLKIETASITIPATNKIYLDGGSDTYIVETSADTLDIYVGAQKMMTLTESATDSIETYVDVFSIEAAAKLYLDGAGDTYIEEASADIVRHHVGGDIIMQLSEKGDDGKEVSFGSSCVGFTQLEPTYDSGSTVVDFRHSNKQNLTFGAGNIGHLMFYFPLVSGNFQLLIKQDGTGSRTITGSYKVYEFDESAADGSNVVKFAGGSNPTLTTDANHVDILSFYWDADNEICYGVATLDFQF